MENRYVLVRKKNKSQMTKKYFGQKGYELTFKKNIENGIKVKRLIIYDDLFIQNSINKKIRKRFKTLLELVMKILESDDPSSGLMMVLDETEKFRRELMNKYNRYLLKKEQEFNNKKINAIEKEVQKHLNEFRMREWQKQINAEIMSQYDKVEKEVSRRR